MKCGLGGTENPSSIFPMITSRPKLNQVGIMNGTDAEKLYVGQEADDNSAVTEIERPITSGLVKNWDSWKQCVDHAITTELRKDPRDHKVLLTEAPSNPKANRHEMFRLMLEEFNVEAVQCQVQAILALYASGRTTGMVLDSGDGVTHTVPVYRGYANRESVGTSRLAGRDITDQVVECLNTYHGRDFRNHSNRYQDIGRLKEKVCRVALNFEDELAEIKNDQSKHVTYEFQDGSTISCAELIIEPAEILFNPRLKGKPQKSVNEMIRHSIEQTDMSARKDMFENNVLSGGTTCFEGFQQRVEKVYKEIVPEKAKNSVKITAEGGRKYSVFVGGAILVELSTFQDKWITREEFEERGYDVFEEKSLF